MCALTELTALRAPSFISLRDSMEKKYSSLVQPISPPCWLREPKSSFRRSNLMPLWFKLMRNGGTLLKCFSMSIASKNFKIIINTLTSMSHGRASICGIQLEMLSSGPDSTYTQPCSSFIIKSQLPSLSLNQVSRLSLLLKRLRKLELNNTSLVQNSTKNHGLDLFMRQE